MREWGFLFFVVMTIICWGFYVPMIHDGQKTLGGGIPSAGGLRAFLLVGVAYFLTAVLAPLIIVSITKVEPMEFNSRGVAIGLLAGALGAVGALGIILAIKVGGKPIYIAPLVFAGAPIVSTFVAMAMHPPASKPQPMFYVGLVLAAVGAMMVLRFKPAEAKPAAKPSVASTAQPTAADGVAAPLVGGGEATH